MPISIDHARARDLLLQVIREVRDDGQTPSSEHAAKIEDVITGSHLTYRYILLTGLLAKATDGCCDPLALQAGAELSGAYDARSLCHRVIVPVERAELEGKLGGSNEPFLNKPARFRTLSTENAVRAGRDLQTLEAAIEVLSNLDSPEQARRALRDAIVFVLRRPSRRVSDVLMGYAPPLATAPLLSLGNALLSESCEGESSALVTALCLEFAARIAGRPWNVVMHPINQSGQSSRETSDIDVYDEDSLIYAIEVKDKHFTSEDVEHAVEKVRTADGPRLLFAVGPRGRLLGSSPADLEAEWAAKGFDLVIVDIESFLRSVLALSPRPTVSEVGQLIDKFATQARLKDATMQHVRAMIERNRREEEE